jgi:hypothetical protein
MAVRTFNIDTPKRADKKVDDYASLFPSEMQPDFTRDEDNCYPPVFDFTPFYPDITSKITEHWNLPAKDN